MSLDLAEQYALRCGFKRYQIGAVITNDRQVLSQGWAHIPERRLAKTASMHAEIHALARGRHTDLSGATCYVATIARKSGNRTSGKPCLTCAVALRAAGVRYVVYTVSNTDWELLRLEDELSGLKLYTPEWKPHG